MKLNKHIEQHYNGVVLQFAQANGFKRQQVEQCLSKGYYHVLEIDDKLMLVIAKRELVKPL